MTVVIRGVDNIVHYGPIVTVSDGSYKANTTGLTFYVSKNGGAAVARNSGTAVTYDRDGRFIVPLSYTDCNTHGRLDLFGSASGTLCPTLHLWVVPQDMWNSLFVDGIMLSDVFYWGGSEGAVDNSKLFLENATALGNLADFFDGTGYDAANSTVGTVTDLTNAPPGSDGDVLMINGSATAAQNFATAFTGGNYYAYGLRIKQTDTVTNPISANLTNLGGSATDFQRLQALAQGAVVGLAGSPNTTTTVTTILPSSVTGFYMGKTLIVLTGANAGQGGKLVTAYDGATKRLTLDPALTSALSPGDFFVLVG